jgi:hypothetical protein
MKFSTESFQYAWVPRGLWLLLADLEDVEYQRTYSVLLADWLVILLAAHRSTIDLFLDDNRYFRLFVTCWAT